MTAEDSTLKNYLDNCRLEHWVEEAKKWAKEKLKQEKKNQEQDEEEAIQQVPATTESGTSESQTHRRGSGVCLLRHNTTLWDVVSYLP